MSSAICTCARGRCILHSLLLDEDPYDAGNSRDVGEVVPESGLCALPDARDVFFGILDQVMRAAERLEREHAGTVDAFRAEGVRQGIMSALAAARARAREERRGALVIDLGAYRDTERPRGRSSVSRRRAGRSSR